MMFKSIFPELEDSLERSAASEWYLLVKLAQCHQHEKRDLNKDKLIYNESEYVFW